MRTRSYWLIAAVIAASMTGLGVTCTVEDVEDCGDGTCDLFETCTSCPEDCGVCPECGDGTCDATETCSSCPGDCGACGECGDGTCDSDEDCSTCPEDCGACGECGDGTCDGDEDCSTCPGDCGVCPGCGDGSCATDENCASCPDDCGACPDIWFIWDWTIEGHEFATTDYDALCAWAGWGSATVQLIVDVDYDTTWDFEYEIDCAYGSAMTDPDADPAEYYPGQEIWFAFQFLDFEGTMLAWTEEYVALTLAEGENDLGSVDFDFGDYGPLDVLVQWATDTGSTTHGDCAAPPEDVYIMGYLLYLTDTSGDILMDAVDIDTDLMACTTDLSWLETDFGTYYLILDGEDLYDTYMWGVTCTDLVVDNETANAYRCDVVMTDWP